MAGQIRVEVEGFGTLEFPDGTDPSVIDSTVKRELTGRRLQIPLTRIDTQRSQTPSNQRSMFSKAVDMATTPLVPQIATGAARVADAIDTAPRQTRGSLLQALGAVPQVTRNLVTHPIATGRGLVAGAVEGAGQLASQLTSPLDAALTATGLRSVRSAAPLISKAIDVAGNTALALRGGERLADAEDGSEAGTGILQAALGAAGARTARMRPSLTTGRVVASAGVPEPDPARATPATPKPVPAPNPERRRELLNAVQARDAFFEPGRMNAIRAAAETGEILTRPTTATPRVLEGVTRRPRMAAEIERPETDRPEGWKGEWQGPGVPLEDLPAVRRGTVTPQQAGFLKWLSEDLGEFGFQRGGSTRRQRDEASENWRPGDPDEARHGFVPAGRVAGTPTQQTFNALGIDATRPEIAMAIDGLLAGKSRGGAIEDAALRYVEAMREAWTGGTFDWSRVTKDTLERLGLRSQAQLKSPMHMPESVFASQGPETREYFAPNLRTASGETTPIPSRPIILEGLQRRRPSEDVRTSQPIRDPLAHVEPFLQRFPEELRPGLRQVLADNQGFADQRRQSMPFGVTDRLARQLAVDVSRTLPKGTALNAEQLRAHANAVATTGQKIRTITEKVTTATATDVDLVALEAARSEHAAVLASMMGARAEAGRALSSFRMFSKVLETGDTNLIRAALKAPGARSGIEDLAKQLAAVGDDPIAQYQFLAQQAKPTVGDKFRSYFYANILSGLKTHERNFLGNAFNSLTNLATVPMAAAVDVARSRATGQPRQAFAGELPHQVMGGIIGTQRGLRDFIFTLKNGISPRNLSGTLSAATASGQFDLPRVELGGGAKNPFNWPGRMLDATDAFFRSIAKNQEFYGLAYAQARREGVKGPQITDRIAALKVEDSPLARSLEQQADTFATRAVFQDEPGKVAQWLQRGSQAFPPLAFVIPFIKTPANILRQGAEFSPAGALMQGAKQPGRVGSQAQARVALGTMMLAPLAWLAATGRLSGSGPQDSAERAGKMEAGWRPNSVKLRLSPEIAKKLSQTGGLSPAADGEYWVSYSLFQPVSVPASVIANAFESWQAQDGKGVPSVSTIATAAMRTGRSVLDQSYLSGLFDFLEAVDNPDSWASRYLARVAHSLTPFAGAQRTVQQALDPMVRQPKGFAESFQANVPGQSQNVPARVDRFGEEVARDGHAGARAADPFNVSPVKANPVAVELERLGVDVSLPNARIAVESGRVLSRDEEQQVKQARGRAVGQSLGMLVNNPAYARLNDDAKRRALLRLIERARSGATRQLRGQLREDTP